MPQSGLQITVVLRGDGCLPIVPLVRKWCRETSDRLCKGAVLHVCHKDNLSAAVRWVRERPGERILIAAGYRRTEIRETLDSLGLHFKDLGQVETIIHSPQWGKAADDQPSASLLAVCPTVTRTEDDLLRALRKSILRIRVRNQVCPRILDSQDDLRSYFSLRYRVWKEVGYLSPQKEDPESQWELDYTDRTSLPFGLFAQDGSLVACGRLVRGLGEEYPHYVSLIKSLIEGRGSSRLRDSFAYPAAIAHPFDVLEAFREFPKYYCRLVRAKTSKAEVSRIIVRPEDRGGGLGEVLVDSLVSLAQQERIAVLFLACEKKRAAFYRRCGFQAIPDMSADRFFAVEAPVIAMDRRVATGRAFKENQT